MAATGLAGGGSTTRAASGENPWRYDVDSYRRVDPALVRYEREGRFAVGGPMPRRLVFGPDNQIYVASGRSVRVFGVSGERLRELPVEAPVRCLRVASDGKVWVGLRDQVRVLDPQGEETARWPVFSGRPFLTGIALTEEDVFVADSGNRVIYRCTREGRVELRLGERNTERGVPGLVLPSPFLDVEMGGDGLLRVNNSGRHKIEYYTRDGDLEMSWGRPGVAIESFCGCCNPVGLAVGPEGRVITAEKGLPRVKVYGPDGTLESVVAGPDAFAPVASEERAETVQDTTQDGLDVALAADGRVAVLDLVGATVQVFRRRS